MSADAPKAPTTADLLSSLIDEIRGLRDDIRHRSGLPDVRIGKSKKHPEYEGKAASGCPADFLLDHAEFLEWKADRNREEGKMQYVARDEREALMCRRWAAVNRNVVAMPTKAPFRKPDPSASAQETTPGPEQGESKKSWGGSGWARKSAGARQ